MTESLDRASQRLRAALDDYISACTFVRDSCVGGSINNNPEFYKHLEREWDQSLDHRTRLAEAQAAINVTRNTRPKTIAASLPAEVLIQIFSLLLDYKSCIFIPRYQSPPRVEAGGERHILYPDTLSHVCSSWRRLIIGLPRFWSHVDLVLGHPLNPGFFARAKTCVVRAGEIPLRVHICDTGDDSDISSSDDEYHGPDARRHPNTMCDFRFLPSLPADISCLEVEFEPELERLECHTAILEYFLGNCKPGVFTCYSMKDGGQRFLETTDSPQVQGSRLLKIPRRQLEEVWLRTTSLRINGTCPPWNNQAYHGLTELRLGEEAPPIRESQLVNMLRWSPKLRVFHLRTDLSSSSLLSRSVEPVRLEELEELDIKERSDSDVTHGAFLRWIAPGSGSLQLNFCGWSEEENTGSFCRRSNITRLYLEISDDGVFDHIILHHLPRLEFLGLNAAGVEEVGLGVLLIEPTARRNDKSTLKTCIDTLYLFNFRHLSFQDIQDVVKRYSVKHLIVRTNSIAHRTGQRHTVARNLQDIKSLLSTLQPPPDIQYLDARSSLDSEYW